MEPENGRGDDAEASLLSRRQYLLAAGAVAGSAGVGVGNASAAATDGSIEAATVSADHNWTTRQIRNTYSTPVVVAPSLSYNGTNPSSPRVRNVTGDGFELAVEEWRYLDGLHLTERIGYLSGDVGSISTSEGRQYVFGKTQCDHRWTSVSFSSTFESAPVVFSNAQTRNGRHPIVTRHRSVTKNGLEVRLQEEEAEGPHLQEEVGFVAIEPGIGTIDGRAYEVRRGINVGATWRSISFDDSYQQPVFLADQQTTKGTNTATVRYRNLTGSGVEVKVEEERSQDREVAHVPEEIGYCVVEGEPVTESGYGNGGYGVGGYGE